MSHIGILGGGQLGKMTAEAAARLGISSTIYAPEQKCPAQMSSLEHICSPYSDMQALETFARKCPNITFEFEGLPLITAQTVEKTSSLFPGSKALEVSQNRILEKEFIQSIGIDTAPFFTIKNGNAEHIPELNTKHILKSATGGYDGKQQFVVSNNSELLEILKNKHNIDFVLEEFVPFQKEVSIVTAISHNNECVLFPIAENTHKNGILIESRAPARISNRAIQNVQKAATTIAQSLNIKGVLAVEFFLMADDSVLVNEIAPRPHNSCHFSMDSCNISQFEILARIMTNNPIVAPRLEQECTMINIIGNDINHIKQYLEMPNCRVHLYGKSEAKPGRKMGHVNILK